MQYDFDAEILLLPEFRSSIAKNTESKLNLGNIIQRCHGATINSGLWRKGTGLYGGIGA